MAEDRSTQTMFDVWKKQIEEGTQAWTRMMSQAQTADPTLFWRPFMDQGVAAWSKLFTQGPVSPDLVAQWKQFLDQWIAAWGKVLEQAMGTETFARALGKQLEQWLAVQGPAKKAADQTADVTLAALGIPSRSQVIGIAQQLQDLEDRIEGVEDRLGELLSRFEKVFKVREERERAGAKGSGKRPTP